MKIGVDHIGIAISTSCHDGQDNFLMQKRSQNCRDEQGCWIFGGGTLEHGERIEDALVREMFEEYGTKPLESEHIYTREVFREKDGVISHWLIFVHKVLVDPKAVTNAEPDMCDEIGWFRLDALPTPLASRVQEGLDLYGHKLI